jgi:hypothetical protein
MSAKSVIIIAISPPVAKGPRVVKSTVSIRLVKTTIPIIRVVKRLKKRIIKTTVRLRIVWIVAITHATKSHTAITHIVSHIHPKTIIAIPAQTHVPTWCPIIKTRAHHGCVKTRPSPIIAQNIVVWVVVIVVSV